MTANQIAYMRYMEERRANIAKEKLSARERAEQERHNVATEFYEGQKQAETKRHNLVTEGLDSAGLTLNSGTLELNKRKEEHSYAIAQGQLAETARANQAKEAETHRHNAIAETSTIGGALSTIGRELAGDVHSTDVTKFGSSQLLNIPNMYAASVLGWYGPEAVRWAAKQANHVKEKVLNLIDPDRSVGGGGHF